MLSWLLWCDLEKPSAALLAQVAMVRIVEQRGQQIPHEARALLQMAMERTRTWKVGRWFAMGELVILWWFNMIL